MGRQRFIDRKEQAVTLEARFPDGRPGNDDSRAGRERSGRIAVLKRTHAVMDDEQAERGALELDLADRVAPIARHGDGPRPHLRILGSGGAREKRRQASVLSLQFASELQTAASAAPLLRRGGHYLVSSGLRPEPRVRFASALVSRADSPSLNSPVNH